MSVRRIHGGLGIQAGTTTPATSPWGQLLAAGQSQLIDQPAPIGVHKHEGYGGTVGGLTIVAATVRPIVALGGYNGDVPQAEQRTVKAAPPWARV